MPPTANKKPIRKQVKSDAEYKITFFGTYFTNEGPGIRKQFEIDTVFDQEMLEVHPTSTFRNDLAPVMMPRKYPDFKRLCKFDYHPPEKISGEQFTDNPDLMSREELLEYATNWNDGEGMELELALYPNLPELRMAVKEYNADPEGFLIRQADMMEKGGDKVARKKAALAKQGIEIGVEQGIDVELPKAGKTQFGKEAAAARKATKENALEVHGGIKKKANAKAVEEDF